MLSELQLNSGKIALLSAHTVVLSAVKVFCGAQLTNVETENI